MADRSFDPLQPDPAARVLLERPLDLGQRLVRAADFRQHCGELDPRHHVCGIRQEGLAELLDRVVIRASLGEGTREERP